MGWKRFFKRAGIIAVVLFVVSWTTFAAQEWAYHRAWQDPRIGCGNVEHPWHPVVLSVIDYSIVIVMLPALPVLQPVADAASRAVPNAVGRALTLGLGSLGWAVFLATTWTIIERLLDRYRRRTQDSTLRS